MHGGALELAWDGERGEQLKACLRHPRRAARGARSGGPQKPAANGSCWAANLAPEFEVTSGIRRISEQQMAPLRRARHRITPEVVDREKWIAFWDAPLMVPGSAETNLDLPRKPEEIRHALGDLSIHGAAA